ncbi:MAG: polymer-forming cytoskeletal protein [Pseudomonadota bacterium]
MGKKNTINLSIIDRDLEIDGTIVSKGKLIIKGSIKGSIKGETLIIAEEGNVSADAHVESITIGGNFQGELVASRELIILSTGRCSGKVTCRDLIVENGGILNADVACVVVQEEKTGTNISELKPGFLKKG